MATDKRINFHLDEDLHCEVAKQAAAKGMTISNYARNALHEAVANDSDRAYAPLVRQVVREELERWLNSERIQLSFAADDFFSRLSVDCMAELAELRQLVNACLWLSVTNTETLQEDRYTHRERDGKDYSFNRSEWYEAAMENGDHATLDESF